MLRSARNDGPVSGNEERAVISWSMPPGEDAERDYFAIEDETGVRYWLYRTGPVEAPQGGRWFLHGLF